MDTQNHGWNFPKKSKNLPLSDWWSLGVIMYEMLIGMLDDKFLLFMILSYNQRFIFLPMNKHELNSFNF